MFDQYPLMVGARVRFAGGPLPWEGEVEIRWVPEPAEYTALSPEHEDYLRAQIAQGFPHGAGLVYTP